MHQHLAGRGEEIDLQLVSVSRSRFEEQRHGQRTLPHIEFCSTADTRRAKMDSGRVFRCTVVACASNQHNGGQTCNAGRNAPDAIADKSSMSASPTCTQKLRFKAKCHCLPDSGSPEGSGALDMAGASASLSLMMHD